TATILSDASYEGLGGYSVELAYRWRLSRQDLVDCGFDMRVLEDGSSEPSIDAQGLHINTLELLAIIINLWMALSRVKAAGRILGGHIISVLADNTTALSWMKYAAQSHRLPVRRLSRFTSALTIFAGADCQLIGTHIPGKDNVGADALSRLSIYPTWASATSACFQLGQCQAFHVKRELLCVLSSISSLPWTGEPFEQLTMRFVNLGLTTLPTGYNDTGLNTSLLKRSHRTKRCR
ncbi:MAG: hypothetical protein ACRDL7_04125, partial [Gaiellaceae bacterium]